MKKRLKRIKKELKQALTRKSRVELAEGSVAWYCREYVDAGFRPKQAAALAQLHYEVATIRGRLNVIAEAVTDDPFEDEIPSAFAGSLRVTDIRAVGRYPQPEPDGDGMFEHAGVKHLLECAKMRSITFGDATLIVDAVPCTCGSIPDTRTKVLACDPYDDHQLQPCPNCPDWFKQRFAHLGVSKEPNV